MSWQDVFELSQIPEKGKEGKEIISDHTQVSHFSQFPHFQEDGNKNSMQLHCQNSTLASHYFYENITLSELKVFLENDWDFYKNDVQALVAWAKLLFEKKLMEQLIIPPSFTASTVCKHCGKIPIHPGQANSVLGCPWCIYNPEKVLLKIWQS